MPPQPWEQVEPSDRDSDRSTHTMSVSTPDSSDRFFEVDDESYSDTDTGDLDPEPVEIVQRPNRLLTDSVYSDYSEMAFPVKEHLANIHINQEQEFETFQTNNDTLNNMKISRSPEETEEQFHKRLRKINYLSLAQEFAALKQENADALPFNLHRSRDDLDVSPMSEASSDVDSENYMTDSSAATPVDSKDFLPDPPLPERLDSLMASSEPVSIPKVAWEAAPSSDPSDTSSTPKNTDCIDGGPATPKSSMDEPSETNPLLSVPAADSCMSRSPLGDKSGDFDVYNMESTLPHVDWDLLEEHLQRAAEEESRKRSRRTDREEIRRRLAMGGDEEYYGNERALRKPSLQSRLQGGMNLQLCFMNEIPPEGAAVPNGESAVPEEIPAKDTTTEQTVPKPEEDIGTPKLPRSNPGAETEDDDFFARQARLQDEARMALAQVRPMAHMQLEIEKQQRKKSPIAEIVNTVAGMPKLGAKKRMAKQVLYDMNVAQLQVVVNDLHTQIESLNEDLVMMLVERDDLHMEQDSMLVDIEDLTRRAQEIAAKVNSKPTTRANKKPTKKK